MLVQGIVRRLVAPLARLVYRPVVEGRGNVPERGPVILAANHLSFLDSIVIPLVAPRPVAFLAKAEYFRRPGFLGWLTRACLTGIDAVPVPRGGHRAAQESLEVALGILAAGRAFGIHPEGSRSRDGRLYRGRTGVAWLALASGAPVVPVAVAGTDRIQPVGARLPRIGRITVRFGAPLHFTPGSGSAGQARRAVTDEIMAAIRELSGQELAEGYNELSATTVR
ncbi:lysophospholipid acyltransferase family protein [Micromonospora narathiwatensis]|uniref:1-acyl-sn-glycerol-3-phosphate acyltransferase n=1 Tax=Micromonospora narathiwatensis TaxID=299146 RepID=A0A1A8ZW27_9ACTN|nr:lysophospholipid acyltransferase family protein [Micromonospora narathiwatensis]SBT48324.1 1-acyl-sn-glycerol-3-phosphate acyltransferase [Micromonospora narathiwatensis]